MTLTSPTLGAWYDHLEAGVLLNLVRKEVRLKRVSKEEARSAEQRVAQARTRDSTRVFAKRAAEIDGDLRIVADPPLIVPIEDLIERGSEWEDSEVLIKRLLNSYRHTLGRQHHPIEEFHYSTWPARWWASAVWGPAATSSSWWAATATTPCSCR